MMSTVTPDAIFYSVITFSWLEFLWETYLSRRQRRVYREETRVPHELEGMLDEDTFQKARLYALDKSKFGAINGIFSQLLSTAIMWFAGFKLAWDWAGEATTAAGASADNEIVRSMLFVLLFNIFNTVVNLPFGIYWNFVIEESKEVLGVVSGSLSSVSSRTWLQQADRGLLR